MYSHPPAVFFRHSILIFHFTYQFLFLYITSNYFYSLKNVFRLIHQLYHNVIPSRKKQNKATPSEFYLSLEKCFFLNVFCGLLYKYCWVTLLLLFRLHSLSHSIFTKWNKQLLMYMFFVRAKCALSYFSCVAGMNKNLNSLDIRK